MNCFLADGSSIIDGIIQATATVGIPLFEILLIIKYFATSFFFFRFLGSSFIILFMTSYYLRNLSFLFFCWPSDSGPRLIDIIALTI